jgi:ferredoxin
VPLRRVHPNRCVFCGQCPVPKQLHIQLWNGQGMRSVGWLCRTCWYRIRTVLGPMAWEREPAGTYRARHAAD